jgi:hypothetical protein
MRRAIEGQPASDDIYSGALEGARELAAGAKDGSLKTSLGTFSLKFDRERWFYRVYGPDGGEYLDFTNVNTKSLKQARQWLREYLAS